MENSSLTPQSRHIGPSIDTIRIRGARVHNLKNVDVDIPHNQLVVITGPSGSGKSSLAFDTLFAEGQRQYVESLSVYARQFLNQMERPDVDSIEGLQPTICIDQRRGSPNPRSTVATLSEIYDYLRLLMARAGVPYCPDCKVAVLPKSPEQIQQSLLAMPEGTKLMIMAPLVRGQPGTHADVFAQVRKAGFIRVRVDGQIFDVERPPDLSPRARHHIDAIIDRIVVRSGVESRIADAIQLATKQSNGFVTVSHQETQTENSSQWTDEFLSTISACPVCERQFEPLEPRSFSFNSPYGACPGCDGLGVRTESDPELFFPDRSKSLSAGACLPWKVTSDSPDVEKHVASVAKFLQAHNRSVDEPLDTFPTELFRILLHGDGKNFMGMIAILEYEYSTTIDADRRDYLQLFRGETLCQTCAGARLRPESLGVLFGGINIDEICRQTIDLASTFFRNSLDGLSTQVRFIAEPIVIQINQRLRFLLKVGVNYLTLKRSAETLSGGELQRVRLATSIGAGLVGVCYVLDEPSIGLHPSDNERLISALRDLQLQGNSVVVVEHDEAIIREADWLIDVGPGAGTGGGEIVARGLLADLIDNERSVTGRYLAGRQEAMIRRQRRHPTKAHAIALEGVTTNNLQDVSVKFPLGVFLCVTGVSGSGKSSLVNETLGPALIRRTGGAAPKPGPFKSLRGANHIAQVIAIDQSPIGRSPRSNPATFTGIFDEIRKIFAATRDAKLRGFRASRFSFNAKGGRCDVCQGHGVQRIEMNFLPDLFVICNECGGARFNRQTLQVKFRGKSVADVLNMPVAEALSFFENFAVVHQSLQCLNDVGLGYVPLGQPASTLSGGEAQRIKLANQLAGAATGTTLYLLDEPTTGLHFEDISRLLAVLHRLVDRGNTVIVIEHNLAVIQSADWIIDIGPDGGSQGGRIVAEGTPEQIAEVEGSHTGKYLRQALSAGRQVGRQ